MWVCACVCCKVCVLLVLVCGMGVLLRCGFCKMTFYLLQDGCINIYVYVHVHICLCVFVFLCLRAESLCCPYYLQPQTRSNEGPIPFKRSPEAITVGAVGVRVQIDLGMRGSRRELPAATAVA